MIFFQVLNPENGTVADLDSLPGSSALPCAGQVCTEQLLHIYSNEGKKIFFIQKQNKRRRTNTPAELPQDEDSSESVNYGDFIRQHGLQSPPLQNQRPPTPTPDSKQNIADNSDDEGMYTLTFFFQP